MILIGTSNLWYKGFNGTPSDPVRTITFENPEPLSKVWRSGISDSGTITPPTGYTSTWQIINSKTRVVTHSGSGNTVNHTFTFVSMDDCNIYDLLVTVTNGVKTFKRMFPQEFRCLPVAPTTFDRTISAATYLDDNWTNRPGYRIRVTGTITGMVELREFKSDDPTQPIHVVFDDCTINSTTWNFKFTSGKNIIFDGLAATGEYGLTMNKTGVGQNQMFQFEWNHFGADIDKFSENIIICGVDANGQSITGEGNTGFRILPGGIDGTVNYNTRTFEGLYMFKCRARNTYDEGYYIGYFTDAVQGSGYRYTYINDALFFDLHGDGCGREVFQIYAKNSKVSTSTFKNGNTRQIVGHRNCVQLSGGTDSMEFYQNWIEQNLANNLFVPGAGETGGNDIEVHSNIFYSGVGVGDIGNIWSRADLSVVYNVTGISQKFYNNTIIYTAGASAFTLYEAFATDFNKFEAVGNVTVGATTTDYENGSGMNASHATFSNYELLTANIATAMFTDSSSKDYRPNSLSSPMFGSSTSITKNGVYAAYDYDGYEFSGTYPIRGAHSGIPLLV